MRKVSGRITVTGVCVTEWFAVLQQHLQDTVDGDFVIDDWRIYPQENLYKEVTEVLYEANIKENVVGP